MTTGRVRSFNPAKGWGFLTTADGDVFVHRQNVDDALEHGGLRVDEMVSFVLTDTPQGPRAMHVRRVLSSWLGRLRVWLALE